MSQTTPLIHSPLSLSMMASTPRARRGAAAVLAQYIQDLSHSTDHQEHAAAA